MDITRKEFALGLAAAAAAGAGAGPASAEGGGSDPTTPRGEGQETYFFKNSSMEFVFLNGLGRAYHQANNIGKMLWLSRQVKDGDMDGAFLAFKAAGDEATAIATASAAKGHRESARQAWLWAQNYYDVATYFVDGSSDPAHFLPTWEGLYAAWLQAIAHFDPPGEPVEIP